MLVRSEVATDMSSHTAGDLTRRSNVRTLDRFPAELLETILLGLSGRDAASSRRVGFRLSLLFPIDDAALIGFADVPRRRRRFAEAAVSH